jgi:hypothetical protein
VRIAVVGAGIAGLGTGWLPEEAATSLVTGLERGEFEIRFPRAFTRQLKLLRILPYRLYFAAVRRSTGL